ncbi:hypothetical protein PMAYCL1PPCAC_31623, partial [Pristionchus mayeri]
FSMREPRCTLMLLILALLPVSLALFGIRTNQVRGDFADRDSSSLFVRTPLVSSKSVASVLSRLPKWVAEEFSSIEVDESGEISEGHASLSGSPDGVQIVATSPVDALYAVHSYLREFCGTMISWEGQNVPKTGNCQRPTTFERTFTSPKVRYFGNPCTYSYSFAWWDWTHWERFIDWMALSGFNMALAPVGQEAIWAELWRGLGISQEGLDGFFPGPAFLAWHRMGNVQALRGPLSKEYLASQLELNKKIVKRMVLLGIVPVLPTFAGFVPKEFERKFDRLRFLQNACWNHFNATNSCTASLHPAEPEFRKIGKIFVQMQKEIYGDVTNVYSADPFNESPPKHLTDSDYAAMSSAIYEGCEAGNQHCVWLLQSWTFVYDAWKATSVRSFLEPVPKGRLLILDLQAEKRPLFKEFDSFYGHNFVWCLLQNFGGNTQMRGNLGRLHENYRSALSTETGMVGMGLTMEGINQNYVVYQYMIDLAWTEEELKPLEWIVGYAAARYGSSTPQQARAWQMLLSTFYTQVDFKIDSWETELEATPNEHEERREIFLYFRPQMQQRIRYWFPVGFLDRLANSFRMLNRTLGDNELFRQDFADVMREAIQYQLYQSIQNAEIGYGLGNKKVVKERCAKMEVLFEQLDQNEVHQLSDWLILARNAAGSAEEADAFERQARNQVTLWGPKGEISDYARKEWAGLVRKYYAKRWHSWCNYLQSGARYSQAKFDEFVFKEVDLPFGHL